MKSRPIALFVTLASLLAAPAALACGSSDPGDAPCVTRGEHELLRRGEPARRSRRVEGFHLPGEVPGLHRGIHRQDQRGAVGGRLPLDAPVVLHLEVVSDRVAVRIDGWFPGEDEILPGYL